MPMSKRIVISLFFAVTALLPIVLRSGTVPLVIKASGGLAVNEEGRWVSVFKGVEYRDIALQRGEGNQAMELKLLRFNMRYVAPRVLSSGQFQLKTASAKTFVEKTGAIAA